MSELIKTACIQINAGADLEANMEQTGALIREAAGQGASLIATPENTDFMSFNVRERLAGAHPEDGNPVLKFYQALAKELEVTLLIGSIGIKVEEKKIANRSYLLAPSGEIAASYDKIHLFDVDLPDGERYRESTLYAPGDKAVLADAGIAKIGMSICYDVRFPHLYRTLAGRGAQILAIPAAFSISTGQAHWETLLRARAIENGAFVIAPAQTGEHGDRSTWGHSMIIGPWGSILAQADDRPGIIAAEINLSDVTAARTAIPSLQHDVEFGV